MSAATNIVQDEWLLSYAAGSLSQGRELMVASQVAYHEELQDKVADAEAIGGALLDAAAMSPVDASVLEQVLGQLDDAPARADVAGPRASQVMPAPLADYVGTDIERLNWRFMGPGMSNVRLWTGENDERLWLLRAKGGVQMPEHGHNGEEWTLVLKGAFDTSMGRFAVGDMDIADASVEHQPLIDDADECICLVLTEGPIRLNSLVARMIQPFIGL